MHSLMDLKNNVYLDKYTTFEVGGPAKYFFGVDTEDQLIEALKWAKSESLPVFTLGGGSSVLVSDKGFSGLVLHMEIPGIDITEKTADTVDVKAGAGVVWMAPIIHGICCRQRYLFF